MRPLGVIKKPCVMRNKSVSLLGKTTLQIGLWSFKRLDCPVALLNAGLFFLELHGNLARH